MDGDTIILFSVRLFPGYIFSTSRSTVIRSCCIPTHINPRLHTYFSLSISVKRENTGISLKSKLTRLSRWNLPHWLSVSYRTELDVKFVWFGVYNCLFITII